VILTAGTTGAHPELTSGASSPADGRGRQAGTDMADDAQHLIFDADDTLWENNVLFERAIDDFIEWVDHPTLDPVAIRAILIDIERANAAAHGYGSKVFLRSLHDCFGHLAEQPIDDAAVESIARLTVRLASHEMDLMPDVGATLDELGRRHDLLLLTKGDPEEQQRKIDASGLAHHFRRTVVVAEKEPSVYESLAREEALDPRRTWMIGNSIKSDVNPALAVGLGAVFIPHPHTWALEHAELAGGAARLLQLERFAELTVHF
jgi:putative hydrolase of the HAD superfamily